MPEFCIKPNKKHLGVGYKGEQDLKRVRWSRKGLKKYIEKGKEEQRVVSAKAKSCTWKLCLMSVTDNFRFDQFMVNMLKYLLYFCFHDASSCFLNCPCTPYFLSPICVPRSQTSSLFTVFLQRFFQPVFQMLPHGFSHYFLHCTSEMFSFF